MRILAVINGEYGLRHAGNIQQQAPPDWEVQVWRAPTQFPLVIDYPEDFLPESLPAADLILSFAEHKGVAELLPEIAGRCRARAVIAPIDSEAWLPRGLARQLRGWLSKGVACTPKPLCSLTDTHYDLARSACSRRPLIAFRSPLRKPAFKSVNRITTDRVQSRSDGMRPAAAPVMWRSAQASGRRAEQEAGMLHHHFPAWPAWVSTRIFERNRVAGRESHAVVHAPGTRSDDD
jgi:hypothetical protein